MLLACQGQSKIQVGLVYRGYVSLTVDFAASRKRTLCEDGISRGGIGFRSYLDVGIQKPVVFFIRSEKGIPYRGNRERAYFLFVLLSPPGQPRVHQRLMR